MYQFFIVVLAVFWAWSSLRFAAERFFPSAFYATRVAHPLVVAAATSYLCYPDLVEGCAAAGVVGLLVALTDRFLGGSSAPVVVPQSRSERYGLPRLP